jgi:hypothetical protein
MYRRTNIITRTGTRTSTFCTTPAHTTQKNTSLQKSVPNHLLGHADPSHRSWRYIPIYSLEKKQG